MRSLSAFVFVLPVLAQGLPPAPWALVYRGGDPQGTWWRQDEGFCRMVAGGDLSASTTDLRLVQRMARSGKGTPEPPWMLLDHRGEKVLEGAGGPSSREIQAFLDRSGYRSSWERREAFLREHPEHGEAWLDLAACGFRLAQLRLAHAESQGKIFQSRLQAGRKLEAGQRVLPRDEAEALAEAMFQEMADGLEGLLRVPEWTRGRNEFLSFAGLGAVAAGESPRVRSLAERMRPEMLEAWRQEPHRAAWIMGEGWVNLGTLLGTSKEFPFPSDLRPLPGRIWPSAALIEDLARPCLQRKDWSGLLALLQALPPGADPDSENWKDCCARNTAFAFLRALAQAGLERWEEAFQSLQEARRWAGSGWPRGNWAARMNAVLPAHDRGTQGNALFDLLTQAPEPDPTPPPVPEAFRLVRFGKAEWSGRWEALRFADPLVPWGPGELHWEFAAHIPPSLQQRYGWTAESRWALFRGESLRTSGLSCPSPRSLADALASEGSAKLQHLDACLSREPGHLDARRARFALVLPRMPQPVLEWNLAEDARRAWIPLEFGPKAAWHPDPKLWASAALKVLPELEAAIRRWPSRAEFWKAWVTWSAFHPRRPSVLDLAQRVDIWGPPSRWKAGLPKEVHEAIAEALRLRSAFGTMREWFQEGREGLGSFPREFRERQAWLEAAKPIFQYLREALQGLHRDREAAALDFEWRTYTRQAGLLPR